ncbi:hypothetical protein H5410_042242 [Solanum commersonii]|uniref:Zinc finger GRF-type domain-containing protein n=1 Tax=Solanum commersonii TaxID=4109 RepID=A0A9J5XWZ3_SOLCO|nr:hypothetical protein H5410_042242 [Solanum commersonii]
MVSVPAIIGNPIENRDELFEVYNGDRSYVPYLNLDLTYLLGLHSSCATLMLQVKLQDRVLEFKTLASYATQTWPQETLPTLKFGKMKASRTSRNPDHKFWSCACPKENDGCDYFRWAENTLTNETNIILSRMGRRSFDGDIATSHTN